MKGILLAGGSGSRLHPISKSISKQLLPVYDKPAIYYPLSVLMLAGLSEIVVISTPRDIPAIRDLLGDGSELGLKLSYLVQEKPEGIAQAFLLAEEFLDGHSSCLILGDNIFYGRDLIKLTQSATQIQKGAHVFAYHVNDPERYGVVEFNEKFEAIDIQEKPANPRSPWAVTGLYFYDSNAVSYAKRLKPSARGELEITDLNKIYLQQRQLQVEPLGRGFAWLDVGTPDSLAEATNFVQTIEKRQGLKIACLEEIAYLMKFISKDQLVALAEKLPRSGYGSYVRQVAHSPFFS